MMNVNENQMNLVEEIAEEVNEEFRSLVCANVTSKGNLSLQLKTHKRYDEYEIEDMLSGVFEYVTEKYDVDFAITNFHKNTLVVEVMSFE